VAHTIGVIVLSCACNSIFLVNKKDDDAARLFYVIGPSGAGKDSLIDYVRDRSERTPLLFARRYVTRASKAGGEDHIAVSIEEFERLRDLGTFAMHWCGNGLQYGVSKEIDCWLSSGKSVLVNGSRAYLPKAIARYRSLCPILIEVSDDVLTERLLARGRETRAEIQARIERNQAVPGPQHPALVMIRNDAQLNRSGDELLKIVTQKSFASLNAQPA